MLCSCSTGKFNSASAGCLPIRKLDFTQAPHLKELTNHARDFGNEIFPKICRLLLDETNCPPQFDLAVKPLKSLNTGETHLNERAIFLNSNYLTNRSDLLEHFDKVLVHEMAHLATQGRVSRSGRWSCDAMATGSWSESITDFTRFKLLGANGWSCAECNARYPHYTSGYTCGGAFLLYLDTNYGTELIRQLIRKLRQRSDTRDFFVTATGKTLDELWLEFQTTASFKPIAREAYELQQSLGYTNGAPPTDLQIRFERLLQQQPDSFTRQLMTNAISKVKPIEDAHWLMLLYLYLTQPGGCAERFVLTLHTRGELPGFGKNEKGALCDFSLGYDELESRIFPISRTLVICKPQESSRLHYTVTRASLDREWALTKAWRTTPDGTLVEDYSVR